MMVIKQLTTLMLFLTLISCNSDDRIKVISFEKKCDQNYDYSFTNKDVNKWLLNEQDIINIIKLSKPVSDIDIQHIYYDLPCHYIGEVLIDNDTFQIEINAASYIWFYNNDTSFYYGCANEKCKSLFMLQGGNIKRDLDVQ